MIDIRKLYGLTGKFTYDPGFLSTASCNSTITYIDGDKGELLYRGYPIEQLAVNCDFLETCHLLLYGNLPNEAQKKDFTSRVTIETSDELAVSHHLRRLRVIGMLYGDAAHHRRCGDPRGSPRVRCDAVPRIVVEFDSTPEYTYPEFRDDFLAAGLVPDLGFSGWDLRPMVADSETTIVILSRR